MANDIKKTGFIREVIYIVLLTLLYLYLRSGNDMFNVYYLMPFAIIVALVITTLWIFDDSQIYSDDDIEKIQSIIASKRRKRLVLKYLWYILGLVSLSILIYLVLS